MKYSDQTLNLLKQFKLARQLEKAFSNRDANPLDIWHYGKDLNNLVYSLDVPTSEFYNEEERVFLGGDPFIDRSKIETDELIAKVLKKVFEILQKRINDNSEISASVNFNVQLVILRDDLDALEDDIKDLNASKASSAVMDELVKNFSALSETYPKDIGSLKDTVDAHSLALERYEIEAKRFSEAQRLLGELEQRVTLLKSVVDFGNLSESNHNRSNIAMVCIVGLSLFGFYYITNYLMNFDSMIEIFKKFDRETPLNRHNELFDRYVFIAYGKYFASSFLVITLLGVVLTFTIRTYRSLLHNESIFSHKAAAMQSALLLLDTARSDEAKDKIVEIASTSIFSHQRTSFDTLTSDTNIGTPIINTLVDKIGK